MENMQMQNVSKSQMLAMTICCAIFGNAVNVAALVIGFSPDTECDTNIQANSLIMDVDLYLIVGGFTLMGASVISLFSHFICFPPPGDDYTNASVPQRLFSTVIICFELAWSIIGIVLHGETSGACQDTATGKMLLAYGIIYLITAVCGCCGIAVIFKKPTSVAAA